MSVALSHPASALELRWRALWWLDRPLLLSALALTALGLIMVTSASIAIADRELGQPFYYLFRQGLFVAITLACLLTLAPVPLARWQHAGPYLYVVGLILLMLVLVPGIGRGVNGSYRWLPMGPFTLQVSEPMKLACVLYLAGYLVRRSAEVRVNTKAFLRPMFLIVLAGTLLLAEPDFGAAAVLTATALGMLFLGGVRAWQFLLLLLAGAAALGALAVSSPYRMERLTAFMNPWADPFDSGFQLTQALIAFGRGSWFGAGLGNSVQKLFYLPEAHNDFLFAVLAEELGMAGALVVVWLFAIVVWRAFVIGWRAERVGLTFGAYCAYGIGIWLGLQALINMGVNMGILPTKGLTLPLMSYGGSSLLVNGLAIGLLLRIDYEANASGYPHRSRGQGVRNGRATRNRRRA